MSVRAPSGRPDLQRLRAEHTHEAIADRLGTGPPVSYLRDAVYGAVDGTVTTFAVVAGARGAGVSTAIVVVLGLANLLADGFSMAIGNYLGVRTAEERRRRIRKEELDHVRHVPEGEREELRQIYAAKGFAPDDVARLVDVITEDRDRWVATMLVEEHGLPPSAIDAKRAAGTTFAAFTLAGMLPLLPFVSDLATSWRLGPPMLASATATALAFLIVGAVRGLVVQVSPARTALQTLALGGGAATLAFVVGYALRDSV